MNMESKQPLQPELPAHIRLVAGQWLAVAGQQVVGRGDTAAAARAVANAQRAAERSLLLYIPDRPMPPIALPVEIGEFYTSLSADQQNDLWLVGASVAQIILRQHNQTQWDFAVPDNNAVNSLQRHCTTHYNGQVQGNAVHLPNGTHFVFHSYADTRLPDWLLRQPIRCHCLALRLSEPAELLDPAGGLADLQNKLLCLTEPKQLAQQPIAGLQIIRLAAEYGMRLETATRQALQQLAPALKQTTNTSWLPEVWAALRSPRMATILQLWQWLGLLSTLNPALALLEQDAQCWQNTHNHLHSLVAMLAVLQRTHNLDAASELALGLVSARIGNFRNQICDRLATVSPGGQPTVALLSLAVLGWALPAATQNTLLTAWQLGTPEQAWIQRIWQNRQIWQSIFSDPDWVTNYLQQTDQVGVELGLLALAKQYADWGLDFAQHQHTWLAYLNQFVAYLNLFLA
jgi:hypothetical protein